MKVTRAVIATLSLIFMHDMGLLFLLNQENLFFKIIGYFNYIVPVLVIYFICLIYFESKFFKSLGKKEV